MSAMIGRSIAMGAALYFDHELGDPQPLVVLLEALIGQEPAHAALRQWHIDAENHKSRPPVALNLKRLAARIASGNTSVVGVETPRGTADADQILVMVATTPIAKRPERYSLTKCRYDAVIALGARRTANCIDAIVGFAAAVGARAGVIFGADTKAYASGRASANVDATLTAAQNDRIRAELYWRPRWGDVIRGPGWGTFLGAVHVERLGGISRIEREAGCARVVALSSGGAYLQATAEPTDAEPSEALARFLEPVMGATS